MVGKKVRNNDIRLSRHFYQRYRQEPRNQKISLKATFIQKDDPVLNTKPSRNVLEGSIRGGNCMRLE